MTCLWYWRERRRRDLPINMIKMGTAVKIKVNQNAMSTYDFIYKVTCLLIGLSAIYWGYRLFLKGYLQLQGALSAKNKIASLALQRVTPGIFFFVVRNFYCLLYHFQKFFHGLKLVQMEQLSKASTICSKETVSNHYTNLF